LSIHFISVGDLASRPLTISLNFFTDYQAIPRASLDILRSL